MGLRISGFHSFLLHAFEAPCSCAVSSMILLLFSRILLILFLCFPAASTIATTTAAMALYKRSLSTTKLVSFSFSTTHPFQFTYLTISSPHSRPSCSHSHPHAQLRRLLQLDLPRLNSKFQMLYMPNTTLRKTSLLGQVHISITTGRLVIPHLAEIQERCSK